MLYNTNQTQNNYSTNVGYQNFVKQSLEKITAHLGNYGDGGSYALRPKKLELNPIYNQK
jgi:hypothetical protein